MAVSNAKLGLPGICPWRKSTWVGFDCGAKKKLSSFCCWRGDTEYFMGATKEDLAVLGMGDSLTDLPPGFRFHPTDEEIITHYLCEKIRNKSFSSRAIGEVDLNRCEPWDLPSKAKMGEKEWYFFCQRDRKYPTGMRTNRATETGYWKATGKDKEIYKGKSCLVGMKKTLVFYMGRAPKGEKTNWVMHEYRLEGKSFHYNPPRSSKDDWVVCRVFHKSTGPKKGPLPEPATVDSFAMNQLSFVEECLESPRMPSLLESPYCNSSKPSSSFVDDGDGGDVKATSTAAVPIPINPSYLPSSTAMDNPHAVHKYFVSNNTYSSNHHQLNPCGAAPVESMFYPQVPIMTSYHSLPTSAPNAVYNLHQERNPVLASYQTAPDFRSYPKVEQHSNQSLVSASQDTALSTDRNTEISSVLSKSDIDFPSCSAGPAADLADLWSY
ncbi:hypothetical protein Taro_028069 [Colocasia esculenta]|uniref:NAC domain-containing protein n=1 Tax=Colocasia esculenta TaxID=4460 RepID=A0A843VHG8_COLES|nr:hypothetical protein [Colocasia esculenta]